MKLKTIFCILTFIGLTTTIYSQIDSLELKEGIDYDARLFLTNTQIHSFNKLYADFDSVKVAKNWEWKDVDPLGFFTPEENRAKRRELFLFEHNPFLIGEEKPNVEKFAYKLLVEKRIDDSKILIDNSTVKIIVPYTSLYENFKFKGSSNLLEKISELGLEWEATAAELTGKAYTPIIESADQWNVWAAPKLRQVQLPDGSVSKAELDQHKALTGDDLADFVNIQLYPYLKKFKTSAESADTLEYKIGEIFSELKNRRF